MLLHLALLVWVPGCALAAWWQVTVALAGDHLAYLYSVEWPCFAVLGVVVWWNLLHDDPNTVGARALRRVRGAAGAAELPPLVVDERIERFEADDPELRAYNDYLGRLAARERGSGWGRS